MENAGVHKTQSREAPNVLRGLWDPFGFMQAIFGWGRSGDAPLFEVEEKDDTYVCKLKVQLTLPDQADVAHAKAELDKGELTLVVPKAVPPRRSRRSKKDGNARHAPRRDTRAPRRRG